MVRVNDKGERIWNLEDPSDKADFDKIVEKDKKELEKEGINMSEKPKELNVKVSVDSEQIKQLMQEKQELKTELDNAKFGKRFFDDVKEKMANELSNLGVPTNASDIKNEGDLSRAISTVESLKANMKTHSNTGGSPLNDAQLGTTKKAGVYSSYQEMFADLYQRERSGDKSAKQALDQLTIKALKAMRGKTLSADMPPLSELVRKKPKGATQ